MMTSPSTVRSPNTSVIMHGDIINALRNSPKGQLRYDTGWDMKPNAVAQLISHAQSVEDEPKILVLEKAMRVMRLSQEKEIESLRRKERENEEVLSEGTSSGSGSRMTLWEWTTDNNNYDVSGTDDVDGGSNWKNRTRGLGIRDEDEENLEMDFFAQRMAENTNHIDHAIMNYNEVVRRKADQEGRQWKARLSEGLEKKIGDLDPDAAGRKALENFKREHILRQEKLQADIAASLRADEERRKLEELRLEQEYQLKSKQLKDKKAQEDAKAAAARQAEEREQQLKLEQERVVVEEARRQKEAKENAEEQARKVEEQRKVQEAAEVAAKVAAEAEAKKAASVEVGLPTALQGFILKEDCEKYQRLTDLINQYERETQDIVASSDNAAIKNFYSSASKCVNTPLNALANTDPGQISVKINHFIDLLEGRPVIAGSSMTTPFSASTIPNGRIFVMRLLAFRFVKKAESEILSEKKGFAPLATIALNLSRKFPDWATLVQAYFYKLCPFLVPFSFPRGNQSVQEYCNSLGYNLQGSDSTVLNEMQNRIKGYCSLFAIMVQTFEKSGQIDIGEATSFFTIGGVWEILAKTMRLEPQPDTTVMVLQTLLELLADRINQVYGIQFQKLMRIIVSHYLLKIDKVSVGASKSGVVRFQTFIEQKFKLR